MNLIIDFTDKLQSTSIIDIESIIDISIIDMIINKIKTYSEIIVYKPLNLKSKFNSLNEERQILLFKIMETIENSKDILNHEYRGLLYDRTIVIFDKNDESFLNEKKEIINSIKYTFEDLEDISNYDIMSIR